MHEAAIADALIEQVLTHVERHGAVRVREIALEAGAVQLVAPEALELAFAAAAEGTPAQGARLHIVEVPAVARCNPCGREFAPEIDWYVCPHCGQADVEIVAGNDIILKSLVCDAHED